MAGYIEGIRDIELFWDSIKYATLKGSKKADFLKYYPLDYIKERLMSKDWQCWTSGNAFFFTCISIYPSGIKALEVLFVAGEGLSSWAESAWNTLKLFAEYKGCSEIRFEERKGWEKIGLKYEPYMKTRYQYKVII